MLPKAIAEFLDIILLAFLWKVISVSLHKISVWNENGSIRLWSFGQQPSNKDLNLVYVLIAGAIMLNKHCKSFCSLFYLHLLKLCLAFWMYPQNTHLNFIFETETLNKVIKRHEQFFLKKDITWPLSLWRDIHPHSWKEKCQLRVHQNAILHYQDWQNLKRIATHSHGKAVGKQELLYIASENANWYNHYWGVFGSNYHNYICIYLWSMNLLWEHTPASIIWKYTCTRLFIDALFVIENHLKQSKYQFTKQWLNKLVDQIMEHCMSLKKSKENFYVYGCV